jgi:GNAT superfamily N-acetyltransferase
MAPRPNPPSLTTRELTRSTWRDFEALFGRYGGVQAGCWCMFYHRTGPNGPLGDPVRRDRNRTDHRELVGRGRAHGILVYLEGRPIGWCQFGRRDDLPRVEQGRKYRAAAPALGTPPEWRITCFFVDRPHRREGVAGVALRAALAAIRARGGGVVEAYPSTDPRAVAVWFGTVGMFRRERFRVVGPFGRSHVLVRRRLTPVGSVRRSARRRAVPSRPSTAARSRRVARPVSGSGRPSGPR